MTTLKQRMYHLTMYNISEIQKGIQSYHAGIEYLLIYGDTPEFRQWARSDKTVIILNGGTSNDRLTPNGDWVSQGTMEKAIYALKGNLIPCATFHEPDLNNSLSGIAFLCDETVWDKETYPDPVVVPDPAWDLLTKEERRVAAKAQYDSLLVGNYGQKVAFLREWLKQFKLA